MLTHVVREFKRRSFPFGAITPSFVLPQESWQSQPRPGNQDTIKINLDLVVLHATAHIPRRKAP